MLAGLFERCHKMKWKRLISDFTTSIAAAQKDHNHEQLQRLLSEFQHIKQTMKK